MPTEILLQDPPVSLPYRPARLSVDRYLEMIASGIIQEDDRIELLEGVLVEKMTKNPPHVFVVQSLQTELQDRVRPAWHVRTQDPVALATSVPEPDIAVVQGGRRDYVDHHPNAGQIGLIVEVADSTLATDRYKAKIYAAAEIPQYWIVNLSARLIEIYGEPDPLSGLYRQSRSYSVGESVPVSVGDSVFEELPVAAIFP